MVNVLLNESEREVAHFGHGQTIRQGGLHVAGNWCAGLLGRMQARRPNWFHTDQLHFGLLGFDRECDAGEQAATTNWHHHGVDPGHLRQHFQTNGALSCNNRRIVKAIDVRKTIFRGQRIGGLPGFQNVLSTAKHLRAQQLAPTLFDQRPWMGMHTVIGMPSSRPWCADARAWFPAGRHAPRCLASWLSSKSALRAHVL